MALLWCGNAYAGEFNNLFDDIFKFDDDPRLITLSEETIKQLQKDMPLYYDRSSGGMRWCTSNWKSKMTGECYVFRNADPVIYHKDTLFYDRSTGAMRPCIGIVTAKGKCTSYGIFNYRKARADKGLLFYDLKSNRMTTCFHVTAIGGCAHYDLMPNSWSKKGGGFRMTNPSNSYHKRVPRTPKQLTDVGMRMIMGQCTLGLNC